VTAAALAALALAYLYASRQYPLDTLAAPGPGVFPLVTGLALLVLAACQAIADVVRRRRGGEERVTGYRSPYQRRAPVFMAVLLAAYAACVPVLGFLASSGALVVLAARLMGLSSWRQSVALAAGVTVAVYVVFVLWLGVPLPRGLLG
jgi:hypothetical protein